MIANGQRRLITSSAIFRRDRSAGDDAVGPCICEFQRAAMEAVDLVFDAAVHHHPHAALRGAAELGGGSIQIRRAVLRRTTAGRNGPHMFRRQDLGFRGEKGERASFISPRDAAHGVGNVDDVPRAGLVANIDGTAHVVMADAGKLRKHRK
jgi:hypothetical protein